MTSAEVKRAVRLGIFTVTTETERGYYVTCFRMKHDGAPPTPLSQSPECVRPSTARRYGERLVLVALGAGR